MNFGPLTPEITRLMFTHSRSDGARFAYTNAFECGSHNFATRGISPPKFSLQSDLGHRSDSRWALLQISSFVLVMQLILSHVAKVVK